MANAIEKRLPKPVRDQMQTMIAAALGLFIGLRYNDYFRALFEKILPQTNGLVAEGLMLIALTVGVVYATVLIQKGLDGK